ncbi:outer membrane lipoprotein carrier protein [Fluviicoccus keumensis]|uniref:Outer-membrane lipoprotein carrier protein n=2 Tax=Fluviicoccus keumensis TaxID=1435465 RepID=A0A4Q7Z6E5_9GAMM|nr:outer membrane lipoprotein carrier protein [Fluviicoccus keumensis]
MRYTALCLGLLLSAGPVLAAETPAKQLNSLLNKMDSMQAAFIQNTLDPQGKPLQTLSGQMLVRRPGYFRWDTEKPFTQQIIANGEVVWVYDPELQQATRQLLDKQVGNTPALLLSGDSAKMSESFTISEDKEKVAGKSRKTFVLKPKDKDALFETLRVSFSGSQLTGMQLRDSLGQKTDITFSQIKVNGKIADSVFQFTPPKGVDVINEL